MTIRGTESGFNPDAKKERQPTLEITYVAPAHENDGSGSLRIKVGNRDEIILIYSKYFKQEEIVKIKKLLKNAKDEETVTTIIEKIKAAIAETMVGYYVTV